MHKFKTFRTTEEPSNEQVIINAGVDEQIDIDNSIPIIGTKLTWYNRRWMAWLCLSINITLLGLILFVIPIDRIVELKDLLIAAFYTNTLIVISYMAFTSLPFWRLWHGK